MSSKILVYCSSALLLCCSLLCSRCFCGSVAAAGPVAAAVPVDGEEFAARLVAVGRSGQVLFEPDGGDTGAAVASRTLTLDELVRWGHPRAPAAQPMVLLADGSRLMTAADWSGGAAVRTDGDAIIVRSDDWGDVGLPWAAVRGVVFAKRQSAKDRERLEGLVRAADGAQDQVLLTNQDRLTGAVKELPGGSITVAMAAGDAKLPISRVEAVIFGQSENAGGSPAALPQPLGVPHVVGMRDGSLLNVTHVAADANRTELELAGGTKLSGGSIDKIVLLQSLGGRFVYLSDLEPADYRHVPYLDMAWPYARDRNVVGTPLEVGGERYLKGLGMHSAARLTYKLERQYKTFAAGVAVDDSAGRRGSVVFGVYVLREGNWQSAFTSEIVRGGDPPQSVSVDVTGADAMTLVVDFADRGDELDHADWLDARLIRK
jgi:NPCBM/NEW2 domain